MQEWLNHVIKIFGVEAKRVIWLMLIIFLAILLGSFLLVLVFVSSGLSTQNSFYYIFWTFMGLIAVFFMYIASRSILPSFQFYIAFALILSAIAFFTDKYLLPDQVFPAFSGRAVFSLWVSFIALTVSLFYKKLPPIVLALLQMFLAFGFFVSFSFVIVSLPMMAFGWIFIPFAGLGFLAYSPLIAASAFLINLGRIDIHLKTSHPKNQLLLARVLLVIVLLALSAYSGWYLLEWKKCQDIVTKQSEGEIGHTNTVQDLPKWIKTGMSFPINHVSEAYLQPNENRNFLFHSGKLFDPLSYLSSLLMSTDELNRNEKERLLVLLFGYSHVGLERLWSGHSLTTTSIQTHIQIYPESKLAYTETTLTIFNESDRQQEAIYTIGMPVGSVATKLSLWIDGVEQPGRLTFRSQAKKAYNTVVGVEMRDPSLLEWLDGGRLRLKVFPVSGKKSRTVRFGVVTPLPTIENKLVLEGFKLEGPPMVGADHKVHIDVFSQNANLKVESKKMSLKEKIVSDNYARQFTSEESYTSNWIVTIDKPNTFEGKAGLNNYEYTIQEISNQLTGYTPQSIYILVNDSLSKAQWKNVYSEISQKKPKSTKVYIVTNQIFYTKETNKALGYIDQLEIPRFNLFPFYAINQSENALIVTSGEDYSLPLGELESSGFYEKTQVYFSQKTNPVYIASLNGKLSAYLNGLEEFGRVQVVASNKDELSKVLKSSKILIPASSNEDIVYINSNTEIKKESKSIQEGKNGLDLIVRLYYYRLILNKLGKRYFLNDTDNTDLLQIAWDGAIVSPISSLVVLESEKDYERFGIKEVTSKLGQSTVASPGAVPEPEEWMFMIVCALFIMYWYRKQRSYYYRR